ncbi:MAG: DNA-binding NtrC family response regulator [Porticoccaceae bacterium]|jgi:DNA-binding NtrC family response regulator
MEQQQRLLVVDDEPSVLQLFRSAFEKNGIEVLTADTARGGLKVAREEKPDVGIFDLMLPDWSGLDLLKEVQQVDSRLPVIFITAGGTSATAIDAMKLGAFDYLTKPLDLRQVRELVDQAFEVRRLMSQPVALGDDGQQVPAAGDVMVGRGAAMQEVYKAIGRVAPKNLTVLIRGESGSGKELVARAVYHHSDRSDGPFLAVNCAAIPEALLESELFGHEKGSFTGADRRRIGKFEQCNGGTLFLDEIGDMPLALQSKMLRVLQEQTFQRVGGNETIQTNVRIIAATHRDLKTASASGKFRSDLYYRLNVFEIELPSLRERLEDVPLLVQHFLALTRLELDKSVSTVSPEALEVLCAYPWPGNIRELQSVIKQAVLKSVGPVLMPDFLPDFVTAPTASGSSSDRSVSLESSRTETTETLIEGASPTVTVDDASTSDQSTHASGEFNWDEFITQKVESGSRTIYDDAITLTEKQIISRILNHTAGNQVQASELLGITRTTLRNKIKQHGITIGHTVE